MTGKSVEGVIDLAACPIGDAGFIASCRDQLDGNGVVTIPAVSYTHLTLPTIVSV